MVWIHIVTTSSTTSCLAAAITSVTSSVTAFDVPFEWTESIPFVIWKPAPENREIST